MIKEVTRKPTPGGPKKPDTGGGPVDDRKPTIGGPICGPKPF